MVESLWSPSVRVEMAAADLATQVAYALMAAGVGVTGPDNPDLNALVVVREAPRTAEALQAAWDQLCAARHCPPPGLILLLTGDSLLTVEEGLQHGADAVLPWPQQAGLLPAMAQRLFHRRLADLECQPLTGLPSAMALYRRLAAPGPEAVAVLSFDLTHFKAYNDRYGFARGDQVLRFLAQVLVGCAEDGEAVYHLGGDDFAVVADTVRSDRIAREAVARFREGVARFYDESDRAQGWILGVSRETGRPTRSPLTDLSAVGVPCAPGLAPDLPSLTQSLARLHRRWRGADGTSIAAPE
jgi:GGDEF domain-containing protein